MTPTPEISRAVLTPSRASRPTRSEPLSRATTLLSVALAIVVMLASILLPSAPALAEKPGLITVTDTTGEVDPEILEGRLTDVDFRREVDLVVLVLDVTDYGYTSDQDAALNDAVLDHARDSAPELLSENGQKWADGTVILALDPGNRYVGTYAGEDVKLDEGGFEAVQEAMREEAADGDWEEAMVSGSEKYAGLLDRPWWRSPAAIGGALVAVGAAVIWLLSLAALRRAARRRVDESLPRYEDVLATRRLTEAAARTLPEYSPYARAATQDHEKYLEELQEADALQSRLPVPSERGWGWGLKGSERTLSRDFQRTVRSLDDTDDSIIATNDLLNRIGDWRAAWDQELEPLRDSIDALGDELFAGEDMSPEEADAAADVRDLGGTIALELDTLTQDLEADRIDPDSALEQLDTLTRELSAAVARLQGDHISHLATDDDEREVLQDASVVDEDENEYRSVRGRRHQIEHPDGGSPGLFWHLSPVLWYSSWHHESGDALESYRNPSSSSGGGSTTGYSAGGFSGAGSSGRF